MIKELEQSIKRENEIERENRIPTDYFNKMEGRKQQELFFMTMRDRLKIDRMVQRLNKIIVETDFTINKKRTSEHDRKEYTLITFNRNSSPYHKIWFDLLDKEVPMSDDVADKITEALSLDDNGATLCVVIAAWTLSLNMKEIKKTTARGIGSVVAQKAFGLSKKPSHKKGTKYTEYPDGKLKFN